MNVIEIEQATKIYPGNYTAVNQVSFEVRKGEIFGLLGANGAGKTTLISMLTGRTPFSAGQAKILGLDVSTNSRQLKNRIGYMQQRFGLYQDLTVVENMEAFAGLYGLNRKQIKEKITRLTARFDLSVYQNTLAGKLSADLRQRLAFCVAIIHDPELIILDEPTGGIDLSGGLALWELISRAAEAGTTILVTTHYMPEAENCHRVCFLVGGKLAALDEPKKLMLQYGLTNMQDLFFEVTKKLNSYE